MGIEFNFDEDGLRNAIADEIEKRAVEYVENEAGNGDLECECGSRSFDVETWKDNTGSYQGEAVCRECDERTDIEIDTSGIDEIR